MSARYEGRGGNAVIKTSYNWSIWQGNNYYIFVAFTTAPIKNKKHTRLFFPFCAELSTTQGSCNKQARILSFVHKSTIAALQEEAVWQIRPVSSTPLNHLTKLCRVKKKRFFFSSNHQTDWASCLHLHIFSRLDLKFIWFQKIKKIIILTNAAIFPVFIYQGSSQSISLDLKE